MESPVVCVGSSIMLTNATTGGTWTSNFPGIASITPDGLLTGVSGGDTWITYTLPTGCNLSVLGYCSTLPPAISGNIPVCVGSTITLSDASAISGTWSTATSSVATVGSSSGIVTGVGAGTTTATFTSAYGCTVTAIVTVDPLPGVITGDGNVCVGVNYHFG